jgi:hypothetical protein
MAEQRSVTAMKTLFFIGYGVVVLVILFVGGRYVLRLGDPPGPPAQGAEVASLRGFGLLDLDYPPEAKVHERISVFSDGRISHKLVVDGVEDRTNVVPIRPALLESTKQLQQTWCQQTVLPPTPAPTAETYSLYLTCTNLTGRVFYFSRDQLPTVLVDILQEAPPLAPR